MRTPTFISGFKNSQRIRVIVDSVGFYTTVYGTTDICTLSHRYAVFNALMNLSSERYEANKNDKTLPVGFGFNYNYTDDKGNSTLIPVQVDLA